MKGHRMAGRCWHMTAAVFDYSRLVVILNLVEPVTAADRAMRAETNCWYLVQGLEHDLVLGLYFAEGNLPSSLQPTFPELAGMKMTRLRHAASWPDSQAVK